jgi:hypothetical protein
LQFVDDQGQRIAYQRAYKCACFDVDSGNKDLNCDICDEDGYCYECGTFVQAIITGIQDKVTFSQIGTIKEGDCIGGFPWHLPLAFHDKVLLLMKQVREEAFLVESSEEPPRIKPYLVCQLDTARTLNRQFVGYKDWQLDTDGRTIVWMDDNNKPAEGEKFTVQFWIRPTYMVWSALPLERHSENLTMPKHCVLRRKDELGGIGKVEGI